MAVTVLSDSKSYFNVGANKYTAKEISMVSSWCKIKVYKFYFNPQIHNEDKLQSPVF